MELKPFLDAEAAAMTDYHAMRAETRGRDKFEYLTAQISAIRKSEDASVAKCHSASLAFKCAYSTILYPKFSVDQGMVSKSASGGLSKGWKSPGARLAHGRLRTKAVRKLGLLGRVVVNVSEACSTMMCPWCMNLSSPGKFIYYFNV